MVPGSQLNWNIVTVNLLFFPQGDFVSSGRQKCIVKRFKVNQSKH